MGHIIDTIEHGTRTVADIDVSVRELLWNDLGRSFEVHRVDTGEDLTDDSCFDTLPTDEEITDLLTRRQPDWWTCRGCGTRFDARTDADRIVEHVRDCDLVDGAGNPTGAPAATGERQARPTIRRVLNVSTAHLPEDLGTPGGLDTVAGVVAHATEVGFLLWVPNDPDESARSMLDPVPDVVLAIQRYARAWNCDYVLFDADADAVDELPVWDW